ncbi:recombinase family protein [Streptomyces sp. NPDC003688]
MRPLMYGYMRTIANPDEPEEIERIRRELNSYAEHEGFSLEQLFCESISSPDSAFQTMLDTIKRTEVKNVIVPSLWHFARLPGLQEAMRQHIEQETGARIWIVQGRKR